VKLSWQPELDDYVDACRVRRPVRNLQPLLRAVLGILVLSTLVCLLVGAYSAAFLTAILLAELVVLLGIFTLHRRGRDARIARMSAKAWHKHEALRGHVEAEIGDAGIALSSTRDRVTYDWARLRWVVETDRSFVLAFRPPAGAGVNLFSKVAFRLGVIARMPLPKRAPADADALAELRILLIQHAGERYQGAPVIAGRTRSLPDRSA
jgi:hypothetical protein